MVKRKVNGPGLRRNDRFRTVDLQFARRRLIEAQHSHCPYCADPLSYSNSSVDHVWPLGRGGWDGWGNWVACHQVCNDRKGNRLPRMCELVYLFTVNETLGVQTRTKAIGKEYDK